MRRRPAIHLSVTVVFARHARFPLVALALPGQILVRPARFVQFRPHSVSGTGVLARVFQPGKDFRQAGNSRAGRACH
jgi:hypothetical protein